VKSQKEGAGRWRRMQDTRTAGKTTLESALITISYDLPTLAEKNEGLQPNGGEQHRRYEIGSALRSVENLRLSAIEKGQRVFTFPRKR